MDLGTLDEIVKSETGYGEVGDYTTQASRNIINSLNRRSRRFWHKHPWSWNIYEISKSYTANNASVTFDTQSSGVNQEGEIFLLGLQGERDYLTPLSFREYLRWKKTKADESASTPTNYIKLGRNSSNQLKIKLWPTPNIEGTLEGWARPHITEYSVATLQATPTTEIGYFPTETHHVLVLGVQADIYKIQKNFDMFNLLDKQFEENLELLIGEVDKNRVDERLTIPLPAYYRSRAKSGRGSGSVNT